MNQTSSPSEQRAYCLVFGNQGRNTYRFCFLFWQHGAVSAKQDQWHRRQDSVQDAGRIDAVHDRHGQIQDDEVRVKFLGFFDPLSAVRSFSAHLKTVRPVKQIADRPADWY